MTKSDPLLIPVLLHSLISSQELAFVLDSWGSQVTFGAHADHQHLKFLVV